MKHPCCDSPGRTPLIFMLQTPADLCEHLVRALEAGARHLVPCWEQGLRDSPEPRPCDSQPVTRRPQG